MNTLFLSVYRYLLVPIVVVLLPFAALFNRKIREGLRLRRIKSEPLPSGNDPIWIHAASGEFEYAKAVIRELKNKYPAISIVVTYFSPSFAKSVATFEHVDRAIALPLDLPGPCHSFLTKMHPRLLLVARTDLWPEMLESCAKRNIPVVIFSYTQKAFRSPFKKIFTRWMFHWVKRIYCVSETDHAHLQDLRAVSAIEVMGDTRYDQVAHRLTHPKPVPPALHPKIAPCLVAGSTWPEDEAVLLPGLADTLLKKHLKLVLVPHEPTKEHLLALEKQLEALGLTYAYFSNGQWDGEHVLLVDQVGVLAELYLLGQFAFIGGSFRKSVHSVMEALGAGCLTFVGPFFENNREAVQFSGTPIGDFQGVEVIHSHADLRDKIAKALLQPQELVKFSIGLKREFSSRLGASRRLVESLKDLV